jgi:hypothetical protein
MAAGTSELLYISNYQLIYLFYCSTHISCDNYKNPSDNIFLLHYSLTSKLAAYTALSLMTNLIEILTSASMWLNILVGIFIFIFGIIGNCLNIYVFTRNAYRNTTSVIYLLAFSVASCVQIINTLLPRILSNGFQISIVKSSDLYCQIANFISAIASLCAIAYPCWASFDQFVSTSRNAMTRANWSSKQFAYRAILYTILFWCIIFIPNCIYTRALDNTCISNNIIIINIYSFVITPITYIILPIIFVTYFNIGIVKNLRITPIVSVSNTNKRMAKQVRRMLMPQLIILILSGLPFAMQSIYSAATISTMKDADRIAIETLIGHITRLLFYLNYVSSFYIYILMSNEFRKIVRNLFRRKNIVSQNPTAVVIPNV